MERSAEPEREMVRRVAPYGPPAILLAFVAGGFWAGWSVGWSAAIGVAIVAINFVVRLGVIVAIMFLLNRFSWFSPLAFGLAVVPTTILLLGFEMKLMAGGVGRDLVLPPGEKDEVPS